MAFADDITVTKVDTTTKTLTCQKVEAQRCTWIQTDTTTAEPILMRISHREEAIKGLPAGWVQDRHLVEFQRYVKDPTTGVIVPGVFYFGYLVPKSGTITRAMFDDLNMYARHSTNGLMLTAPVDKLMRNEL
jgi:hypothetical protein